MTEAEHLLSCLAEECCEVGQRVSKALRFGLGEVQSGQALTNALRIRQEILDLYGVVELLEERGVLPVRDFLSAERAIQAKKAKVQKYLECAREIGTVS